MSIFPLQMTDLQAANARIRRLDVDRAELVEALERLIKSADDYGSTYFDGPINAARAALSKVRP